MGLRDDIQADIAAAFDADLADAVRAFSASREVPGSVFDPTTGTYPSTTETYTGRGVFGGYSAQEVDGQHVLATDVKLTALQNELTDAPKIGDTLDGYRVINVGKDPASATWSIQLRRS
ncbi:glutamate 5-kinase [uncultured Halomonas sp.]|uniref:glutamate 5-kinase n=1 Tax=uncultured Halomonas sp. TaxID=173971 RepID=UPI0026365487|nr:glutamate 5-kinase [uncultured Halomonas sp.]